MCAPSWATASTFNVSIVIYITVAVKLRHNLTNRLLLSNVLLMPFIYWWYRCHVLAEELLPCLLQYSSFFKKKKVIFWRECESHWICFLQILGGGWSKKKPSSSSCFGGGRAKMERDNKAWIGKFYGCKFFLYSCWSRKSLSLKSWRGFFQNLLSWGVNFKQ